MKLLLVLILSLCAFSASSLQYDEQAGHVELPVDDQLALPMEYELELYGNLGIVEKLRELIEKIIEKAIEAADKITDQINKIITIASEKIQTIIDKANKLINRVAQAILDKINAAVAGGEIAKRCADAATAEIQESTRKAQDELQACARSAIEQIQVIGQDIEKQVGAIKENIEILGDIVTTCLEQNGNPISVVSCITKQANEIREKILSILSNARDGLTIAAKRSLEITQETKECTQKVVVQLQKETLSTAKKFQDCIKESKPHTYLLN